jgi:lysophospholipase L1-like esterase
VRGRWWTAAGVAAAAAVVAVFLAGSTPGAPAPGTRSSHPRSTPAAGTQAPTARPGAAPPATVPPPNAPFKLTGPVVALGDSYTAGDMLPMSVSGRPVGCLRSSSAYPALVAKALGASAVLVDAACTNAGVSEMTQSQRTYLGTNPPQFNVLARDDSLVMMTLGGDDMGFLTVLRTCMELSITDPRGSPCKSHFTSGGTDQLTARVTAEAAKLTTVLDAIRTLAPHARVLLLGYPDVLPQRGGCWPVVPITDGDIAWMRGIEGQLNAMLRQVAAATGATFVDTYTPTTGHDFCQNSNVRDFEGLVPTSLALPFHPNARGQAAMAAAVLAALHVDQAQPPAAG